MQHATTNNSASNLLGAFGIVALVAVAYASITRAGFLWDDIDVYIVRNPLLRDLEGLRSIWFSRGFADYYPLTLTVFWLEWQAWADNPLGYHLVNVVLHTTASLLLWRLLLRLQLRGAWVAAALFAVHPVNVETVAWISQHKNTLASVFFFAALIAHLRFETDKRWKWYATGLVCFALALLSKPSTIALPLLLLGIAWWKNGHIDRRRFIEVIPYFALALVAAAVTLTFQGEITQGGHVYEGSAASRLAIAGRAVWFYLYKALVPWPLVLVYPRWSVTNLGWSAYLPAALGVLCTGALWLLRRRARGPLFAWCAYLLLLAPVLGFVDVGYMQFSFVADHWLYFSLPVVVACLVTGMAQALDLLKSGRNVRALQATGVLVLGVVLTGRQVGTYESDVRAWRHTLRYNPSAWNAHASLGGALRKAGATQESTSHYLEAVRLKPDFAPGHQVLGTLFAQMGIFAEAESHFERALQLQPQSADAQANYGHYLIARGRYEQATQHLQRALMLQPDNASTVSDLAFALQNRGQLTEAAQHYEKSLRLHEDADVAFNLGVVYSQLGRHQQAATSFAQVVRLHPRDVQAYLLLSDQFKSLGRAPEAAATLQEARRQAQGDVRRLEQIEARWQALNNKDP